MTNEPTKLQKAIKDAEGWKRNWTGASKGLFKPSIESIEELLDAAKRVKEVEARSVNWAADAGKWAGECDRLNEQLEALQKENEGLKAQRSLDDGNIARMQDAGAKAEVKIASLKSALESMTKERDELSEAMERCKWIAKVADNEKASRVEAELQLESTRRENEALNKRIEALESHIYRITGSDTMS